MLTRSAYYLAKNYNNSSCSGEEIRDIRNRMFQQLISHCFSDNKFYSEKWRSQDLSLEDFTSIEDLHKLPVVDAEAVRRQMEGIGSTNHEQQNADFMVSAGSESGDRTSVLFNSQAHDWMTSVLFRGLLKRGYRPFMKQIYYQKKPLNRGRIEDFIFPHEKIDPSNSFDEQIEVLMGNQGGFLFYFSNVLFTLAKKIRSSEKDFEGYFDGIVCHGEILTDEMQNLISEVFNSPVYGHFGASEVHSLGWRCPEGGYHINSDSIVVEVVGEDGERLSNSEVGDVALTSLVKTRPPIIRYRIGDLAAKIEKNCGCNSSFPRVQFKGKKSNAVEASNGEIIYPEEIVEILSSYESLLVYRLTDAGRKLKYVPNRRFDEDILLDLREELQKKLGWQVSFEKVRELDATPGGKLPTIDL